MEVTVPLVGKEQIGHPDFIVVSQRQVLEFTVEVVVFEEDPEDFTLCFSRFLFSISRLRRFP